MRARPDIPPPRPRLPRALRARIYAQQNGRCASCGAVLILGFFDYFEGSEDHPCDMERLGTRPLVALCWACH